jgi:hypothetical protein
MLAISALSMAFAVANNLLSVEVGESVARDLGDAPLRRIQSVTAGRLHDGALRVAPDRHIRPFAL